MSDDEEPDLFTVRPHRSFGGVTYDPDRDFDRLHKQLARTWRVMVDGRVRTLAQVAAATSALREDNGFDSEAAISARLRDFRKAKFGGHRVEKYNSGHGKGGLWWYWLIPAPKKIPD
jgi:hypothetical protein